MSMSDLGPAPRRRLQRSIAGAMLLAISAFFLAPGTIASADGGAPNLAYVVSGAPNPASGSLTTIDIGQRKVVWHISVGGDPSAVVLSVDGRFLYIAQAAASDVAVVDANTHHVVMRLPTGHGPSSLVLDISVTGNLFATNTLDDSVTVLNLESNRAEATIPVGHNPTGLAIAGPGSDSANPQDAEVYVANRGDNTVTVLSATHRTVIATIPVPGGPEGVTVPASGGVAYVATQSGTVQALSLSDHLLLGTLYNVSGAALGTMDYDGITGQVYVPNMTHNQVAVLRPATAPSGGGVAQLPPEPARTLAIGGGPAAVAITFDGAYGFVAQGAAGSVAMLDVAAHHTLATLAVGGAPRAIITGSYPPLLDRQAANIVGIMIYVVVALALLAIAGYFFGWFGGVARWVRARGRGSKSK